MHNSSLLIIDDDPGVAKGIKRLLRNENYNIYKAYSGEEGLSVLKDNEIDLKSR